MSPTPSAGTREHVDSDTATRLAAAKLWLVATESPTTCGNLPYLSAALYALIPVATSQVERMTVDPGWRLYVNPTWVAVTAVPEIAARMAHLVWHLLAEHAERAIDVQVGQAQASDWQVATDATVADVLDAPGLDTGLMSPDRWGWPPGKSAEEYFAVRSRLSTDAGASGGGRPGDAQDGGDEPDESCGSGCDGRSRSYDLPPGHGMGQVDTHDAEHIRRRVAIEYSAHISAVGTAPGDWSRWVQRILDPVVPWQQVLASAVRRGIGWGNGHTDYTYSRVSRRQSAAGRIILPALRRPVPEVAVVIDTSGSIDDGLLAQALGEVDGVLAAQAVPDRSVTVLAVDAAVHHIERVRAARDVKLAGGGGTNMGKGLDAALALKPRPSLIVVLTDGYTPWPSSIPAAPVVIVVIGRDRIELPPTPNWAQRVECVP